MSKINTKLGYYLTLGTKHRVDQKKVFDCSYESVKTGLHTINGVACSYWVAFIVNNFNISPKFEPNTGVEGS